MSKRPRVKSIESTTRRIIAKIESGEYDYNQIEHMIQSLIDNRLRLNGKIIPSSNPPAKRQENMIDGGIVAIEEVFYAMETAIDGYMMIGNDKVKANSDRYELFKAKGVTCVECEMTAQYFRKEKFPADGGFHLNLYGVDHLGDEVLFTKDHIITKARGGVNHLSNYQTMCSPCNAEKADK